MHYAATARMMAECVGSALAEDFADASIKEVLAAELPAANSQPFNAGEGKGWAEFKVTPAHRALALRVQGRAQDSRMSCDPSRGPWLRGGAAQGAAPGPASSGDLAKATGAMAEYAQASREQMDKEKKTDHLSFTLQERIREVGLDAFPGEALPTEEAMLRFEKLAKAPPAERAPGERGAACAAQAAAANGRRYLGSAECEDLQLNFMPPWSRVPDLGMVLPRGSAESRAKEVAAAKRAAMATTGVDFASYADFQ
ncbi:unnamed protein product, partial [Prorocentrum cordatum]